MKIKVGDCFRYDEARQWGIATIVAEHGNDDVLLTWSAIKNKDRTFIWTKLSLVHLTPVSKLEMFLLGLDLENDTVYNGEKEQT